MSDPIHRQLLRYIARWDRRLRLIQCSLWLPRGLAAGIFVGLIAAVISRLQPWLSPTQIVILACGAAVFGVIVALVVIWAWPRSTLQAARYFDRVFGLKERSSTALELSEGTLKASQELTNLQLQDALATAATIQPRRYLHFQWRRRELALIVVMIIALAALVLIANPQAVALAQQSAVKAAISQQVQQLQQLDKGVQTNPNLSDAQKAQLSKLIEQAIQKLQQPNVTQPEAVAALSDAAQALKNDIQNLTPDQQTAFQQAGQALSQSQVTQNAGQAMQAGDLSQSANALQNLARKVGDGQITPDQGKEAASTLTKAGQDLSSVDPQVGNPMQSAASALQNGNKAGAQQALQQAANALNAQQQQAQQSPLSQSAQNAAQQAAQASQQVAQAGQQNSQSQNNSQTNQQNSPQNNSQSAQQNTQQQAGQQGNQQQGNQSQQNQQNSQQSGQQAGQQGNQQQSGQPSQQTGQQQAGQQGQQSGQQAGQQQAGQQGQQSGQQQTGQQQAGQQGQQSGQQQSGQQAGQQSGQQGNQQQAGQQSNPGAGQPSGQQGDSQQSSPQSGGPQSSGQLGDKQGQQAGTSGSGQQAGQQGGSSTAGQGPSISNQNGTSQQSSSSQSAGGGAGQGSGGSGVNDTQGSGTQNQPFDLNNGHGDGTLTNNEMLYAPSFIGGSGGQSVGLKGQTAPGQSDPLQSGGFANNPAGQSTVPLGSVAAIAAAQADQAMNADHVPGALRGVIKQYFNDIQK